MITGFTSSDFFMESKPSKSKRGRPKKETVFSEEEKVFLLEHARRGKIVTEIFRLNMSDIYVQNYNQYYIDGKYIKISFEPELKHKNFEKVKENKRKIREGLIKALTEGDEIDMWGDNNDPELVIYKHTDEDDNTLLKRLASKGKITALEEEKKSFKERMKREKRKVLFEKINKPKPRQRREITAQEKTFQRNIAAITSYDTT
jgi:hypothetical protein